MPISEIIDSLNLSGLLVGLCTFLIIGMFHPLVIKGEYYLGKKICRMLFVIVGLAALVASLLSNELMASIVLGVVSFSAFWGVGEVNAQEKRVARGWFPANPRRKAKGTAKGIEPVGKN